MADDSFDTVSPDIKSDGPEAAAERRALLDTRPNPEQRLDYVVALSGAVAAGPGHGAAVLSVRYVPDRVILRADGWRGYLQMLSGEIFESLEEAAVAVLSDVSNELVPRWVEVRACLDAETSGGRPLHEVVIEERQPSWSNPLLDRHLHGG